MPTAVICIGGGQIRLRNINGWQDRLEAGDTSDINPFFKNTATATSFYDSRCSADAADSLPTIREIAKLLGKHCN